LTVDLSASPFLKRLFLRVLKARAYIAGIFLILAVVGGYGAAHIVDDASIDRLIVADDPDSRAAREFERLFPEGEHALLMLEAKDPLSLAALRGADELERKLSKVPRVDARSLIDFSRRAQNGAPITSDQAVQLRSFATGTNLFRRAGLLGDRFIGIALELHVHSPAERDQALAAIEAVAKPFAAPAGPFSAVRRVGAPWLNAWLEAKASSSSRQVMPLFGIFVVVLILLVYRSWRALGAVVLTLAVVVAIAMGIADIFAWPHTIVSALVPLTVTVTTTATLVYIHTRYVEPRGGQALLEHHAEALANKFLPCTASMFATAVGFAALVVSDIRPIRQMGLWTASGLIIAWIGSFTLFPALQSLLRTPTRTERSSVARWYLGFVEYWIPFTARYRWPLVAGALLVMLCGAAALFGVPGEIAPLALQTDSVAYINPNVAVARDTKEFERTNGLTVAELWLQTSAGEALEPQFLRSLEAFTRRLEEDPRITAVDGPTSALRWEHYIASGSDELPNDAAAWPKLAADLEQILLTQPAARAYVDVGSLANARLSIRGRGAAFGGPGAMRAFIEAAWRSEQEQQPALSKVRARVVGQGVLADQITLRLVPSLIQSFALTASVIFLAFLLVFRSPAARLMAMIPSLFAILGAFLLMRLTGITLNIATILIGSTVLGSTENDQIHFFYHFQEGSGRKTSDAFRHALLVAGRPIAFATLINAGGFLALAFSDLPPLQQFGIVSSSAFTLALLADFTALLGALWMLRGGRDQ
jgi:predicted RND superfamily exporter protein